MALKKILGLRCLVKRAPDLYAITIVLLIAVTFDFILFSTLKLWDYSKGKVRSFCPVPDNDCLIFLSCWCGKVGGGYWF